MSSVADNTNRWTTGAYQNDQDISKILTVSGASSVSLHLVGNTEAGWDFVWVYDGNDNLIGKYTGNINETIIIDGDTVRVRLVTDDGITSSGISATLSSVNQGSTYYISSANGDDTNIGTQRTEAFKTVQKALDVASAGDTIIITQGIYNEKLEVKNSGEISKPIMIKGEEGAVIDGTGFSKEALTIDFDSTKSGLFIISGKNHIIIDGLTIKNSAYHGIAVNAGTEAHISDITIRNVVTEDTNGAGIIVYGEYDNKLRDTSGALIYKLHNITIKNNRIIRAQKAFLNSEANTYQEFLTVGGGVEKFTIEGNTIVGEWEFGMPHNGQPLGIDVKDGVRDGNITGNTVQNIPSGGIYVDAFYDGAYNIRVTNNIIDNVAEYGINVGAERGGNASDITITNNTISNTQWSGVIVDSFINNNPSFDNTPLHTPPLLKENIIIRANTFRRVAYISEVYKYQTAILIADITSSGVIDNNLFDVNLEQPYIKIESNGWLILN